MSEGIVKDVPRWGALVCLRCIAGAKYLCWMLMGLIEKGVIILWSSFVWMMRVGLRLGWNAVKCVMNVVGMVFYLIFEPLNLFIRIIEYNVTVFIDFWLMLLINTKLEKIFNIEYGRSQFKMIVQWVRFINVMIISGVMIGILTYYTSVRMIYWMTKLKKKEIAREKRIKRRMDNRERLMRLRSPIKSESLMCRLNEEEFIPKVNKLFKEEEEESPEPLNRDETITPILLSDSKSSTTGTGTSLTHDHLIGGDDEDDILNYGSLESLKDISMRSTGSQGNGSQGNGNWDSLGRESITTGASSNQGTLFSRFNLTPFTTIDEDDEDDEYEEK